MIKLLIADPHPIIRKGLEHLFSTSTNIDIVAQNIADVNTTADDIANVNTTATNIARFIAAYL